MTSEVASKNCMVCPVIYSEYYYALAEVYIIIHYLDSIPEATASSIHSMKYFFFFPQAC